MEGGKKKEEERKNGWMDGRTEGKKEGGALNF
jgi:hypothetical protein